MTAKDKSNVIQLINYLDAKGDESRRSSRDQNAAYFQGWLAGSGNARKECADYLRKLIEVAEIEFEEERYENYETRRHADPVAMEDGSGLHGRKQPVLSRDERDGLHGSHFGQGSRTRSGGVVFRSIGRALQRR